MTRARTTGRGLRLPRRRPTLRDALRLASLGAATTAAGSALTLTLATLVARRVVQPTAERPDDVQVLGVGAGTVTLRAAAQTVVPGRYGLFLDRGAGHARIGEIVDHDEQAGTVTRRLLAVDRGRLREGPARWSHYFHTGDPATALGLPFEDRDIGTPAGSMPAWYVPPEATGGTGRHDRWAILVHGRGASREEALRALPVLHRLGLPSLVVSYRNDAGVVPGETAVSSRYHLGESEWVDVEAAVIHALESGARDVVLMGWSMGGAICLQLLDRSWTADRVRAAVLDAPVVDWRHVLDHHCRVNRVPIVLGRFAQWMLGHEHARRMVSLDVPLPLHRMDWVSRAHQLRAPMLILHSDDDEFVPAAPSRRLATVRPDLVTLVSSRGARHTGEWNLDPNTWDVAVARFLLGL